MTPRYRADQVGSLLPSPELLQAGAVYEEGPFTAERVKAALRRLARRF